MSEPCRTCGKAARIDAPYMLGETEFKDAYCGFCGVNWGAFVKPIADSLKPAPRKKDTWKGKPMSRLGHGFDASKILDFGR